MGWFRRQFTRLAAWRNAYANNCRQRYAPIEAEQKQRAAEQKTYELYGRVDLLSNGFRRRRYWYENTEIRWESVRAIRASLYCDAWICMGIALEFELDDRKPVDVNEHMLGFKQFVAEMEARFEGLPADWANEEPVTSAPASGRLLWQRSGPANRMAGAISTGS